MALDASNDFLHDNGIAHDHAADGSISNIQGGAGNDGGVSGSSIQSSDLDQALGDINTGGDSNDSGKDKSSSSGDDEIQVTAESDNTNGSGSGSSDDKGNSSGAEEIEASDNSDKSSDSGSGSSENDALHEQGVDHTHDEEGNITSIDGKAVDDGGSDSHDHGGTSGSSSGSDDHDHTGSGAADLPSMGDDYSTQTGTNGSDKLIGGDGNDFLFRGDETFSFEKAVANSGAEEFPFPNTSKGSSEADVSLEDGTLKIDGNFKDFQAAPLFSQGEDQIDPNAEILNGSDPQALIDGFKAVPQDVEGNPLSGTHLHFSPSGDQRGNFADATVVRFLENEVDDPSAGTGSISGEFELTPEEQAAFSAGNLYINLHTNVDTDGDGLAGFPTGENRLNLNQNVVKDAVSV